MLAESHCYCSIGYYINFLAAEFSNYLFYNNQAVIFSKSVHHAHPNGTLAVVATV